MIRPDRSDVSVTGTIRENDRLKKPRLNAMRPTTMTASNTASASDGMRFVSLPSATALPREIEVAGLAVKRQSHKQNDEARYDERGPRGAPNSPTHTRRPTRGVETVVGVNEHDHYAEDEDGDERIDHIRRDQERAEVVVVDANCLAVDHGRTE